MTDIIIRPYKTEDIPALTRIWHGSFGDEISMIEKFFELLPDMGKGFVAEKGGEVVGMLYMLDASFGERKVGYVYAVAVKPEYRRQGIGRSLCEAASSMDYDIIATLPAENELYTWYEKVLGTKPVLYGKHERVYPGRGKTYYEINAAEYGEMREKLLVSKPHIEFSPSYLRYQEIICTTYGGGMFAGLGGIACGYIDDGMLHIKEALGDVSFLPALCADLGAQYAVIRTADASGEPFIAAMGALPLECEWNLALD